MALHSSSVVPVVLGLALLAACGSSDSKRKAGPGSDAGVEGGAGGSGAGGSGAGGSGAGGAGTGGAGEGGAGAGGAGAGGGDASTDGSPIVDAAGDGAPTGQDLFVSPTGDDSGPGTRAAPLLTIAHAASLARAGDRIVLLPGDFDDTTQPAFAQGPAITIPSGVLVVSDEPRAARLVRSGGAGLVFEGDGGVQDVVFDGFDPAVRATTGRLTLSGATFPGCGATSAAIDLSGDVDATMLPGGASGYVSDTTWRLVTMAGTSRLSVQGGVVNGLTNGFSNGQGTFNVREDAELSLSGVAFQDNAQEAVYASGTSAVTLLNVNIQRTVSPALAAIELGGEVTLTFEQSTIVDGYWAGISFTGPATATLTGCEISRNGAWGVITNAPGPATLTVRDCLVEDNGNTGLEARVETTFVVEDSRLLSGRSYGITTSPGSTLRLRGTRVENNRNGGVYALLVAGESVDLGTVTEPGGNTFLGLATGAGVIVAGGAFASAVGNTWLPGVQGSSAEGRYVATGAGATIEDTYPPAAGLGANYALGNTGATIRLAENP